MKSKKAISGIMLGIVLVGQMSMIPFSKSVYAVNNSTLERKKGGIFYYNQITDTTKSIYKAIQNASVNKEADGVITMPERIITTLRKTIKISPVISETETVQEYQWYKDGSILEGKTEKELELANITGEQEGEYTLKIKTVVGEDVEEYEASCNVVIATFTTTMTKIPENTYVGEEFEITLRIDSLKNVENGLLNLGGQLNFDSNILEEVKIVAGEGWAKDEKFNKENFKFVTDGDETITGASDIFKIQFKVKDNLEIDDTIKTNISIENLEASNGEMDIRAEHATIDVDIHKKPEDSITSEEYDIENMYISRIATETTISKFKENVKTNTELEFSDKEGNILTEDTEIIKTGTKLKAGKLQFTLIVTGDINGDGTLSVTDIAKLKAHYIEIKDEILTGINLKAADMNDDGEITITDLAQIKEKLIAD